MYFIDCSVLCTNSCYNNCHLYIQGRREGWGVGWSVVRDTPNYNIIIDTLLKFCHILYKTKKLKGFLYHFMNIPNLPVYLYNNSLFKPTQLTKMYPKLSIRVVGHLADSRQWMMVGQLVDLKTPLYTVVSVSGYSRVSKVSASSANVPGSNLAQVGVCVQVRLQL